MVSQGSKLDRSQKPCSEAPRTSPPTKKKKESETLNISSTQKFYNFTRLTQMPMRNRSMIFNFSFPHI